MILSGYMLYGDLNWGEDPLYEVNRGLEPGPVRA